MGIYEVDAYPVRCRYLEVDGFVSLQRELVVNHLVWGCSASHLVKIFEIDVRTGLKLGLVKKKE